MDEMKEKGKDERAEKERRKRKLKKKNLWILDLIWMDHLIFESDLMDYGSDLMKTDQIVDCKIPSRSHLYIIYKLIKNKI
jgi:hypothetical protein